MRPRDVAMPSDSISSTASKSLRVERRDTDRPGAPARTARPRPSRRRRRRPRSAAPGCRAASRGISRRSSSPARIARTSAAHSISSSRVVANSAALRQRAHPVAGAPDALQRDRDRARRADLAHQVHRADVDAQFERRRRHHRAQFAGFQPLLRPPAAARAKGCRDAAAPRPRPAARPDDAPRARTSRRVLTKTSVVRFSRISSASAVVDLVPHLVAWPPRPVRRCGTSTADPSRAGARR